MRGKSEYPAVHAGQHELGGSDELRVAWEDVGSGPGPGGGDYQFIQEIILGADAAEIRFSDIPQTFRHLHFDALVKSDTSNAVAFTYNGDTLGSTSLYSETEFLFDEFHSTSSGSTTYLHAAGGGAFGGSQLLQIAEASAGADADSYSAVQGDIPYYALTTAYKGFFAESFGNTSFSAGNPYFAAWRCRGIRGDVAAVTDFSIVPYSFGGDNLVAGSRAALYGIR